jgi:hypothetical protein
MYYEINVYKNVRTHINDDITFKHFFATAPRSITTKAKLKEVLTTFLVVFPEPMYGISVTMDKEEREGVFISEIID